MGASPEEVGCERKTKRIRLNNRKKLIVDEKVEVRSLDDGFLGSWHSGTVVACENRARHVKYDHILADNTLESIVERVRVSPIIDGVAVPVNGSLCKPPRGLIRPLPPTLGCGVWSFNYGLCVDALYKDAWWEGVIFDHEDGSKERKIFFPDLGDDMDIPIHELRITLDWNEATEKWKRRGNWLFLQLIEEYEQEWPLCVSIKQIWYDVRMEEGFQEAGEWTSPAKAVWRYLVSKVIQDNFNLTVNELLDLSKDFGQAAQLKLMLAIPALGVNLTHEVGLAKSDAIVPIKSISPVEADGGTQLFQADSLVLPCNPDNSSDGLPSINRKFKVSTNRRSRTWLPVGTDILPGAEFCPGAITEYALRSNRKKIKNLNALITNVRKHLSYLGWKMQFLINKPAHPNSKKRMIRVRYISPDNNLYYSLRLVCQILKEPENQLHSPVSEYGCRSLDTSPDDCFMSQLTERSHVIVDTYDVPSPSESYTVVVEPAYCPQAVSDWYMYGKKCFRKKIDEDIAEKAKKHLAYLGWNFWYVHKKTKCKWHYSSPRGKCYYSLRTACKCCIDEGGIFESNAESQESLGTPYALPEKLSTASLEISHSMEIVELSKANRGIRKSRKKRKRGKREVGGSYPTTRVLRSRKRARQLVVLSSSYNNPQTVLSWMIDNSLLLPRAKVHYRSKKDHRPMVEGRVTRNGIKCNCCQKVFTLSGFEAHAGSTNHWPAANIFLEDGRSLLECQKQIICNNNNVKNSMSEPCSSMKGGTRHQHDNDYICSVCHYGGDLILCDQCPSSFHKNCLGLKDIPTGDWFCPLCCCRICRNGSLNEIIDDDTASSFLKCGQCNHQYHVCCLRQKGLSKLETYPKENWFCSKICEKIFMGLHNLLGEAVPVDTDLTWTLLKCRNNDGCDLDGSDVEAIIENYCKLSVSVSVMHECFEPVREPYSGRDLVEDVIFSRGSHLNRLNFKGFYTVLLERNDELISVATVRVHGQKVAEVPLVGTRFQYRRLGMCRILMNELEKKLTEIGVEMLALPAIPSVLNTWTSSFGFKRMTDAERLEFLDYTFLDFPDTAMCHKFLTKTPSVESRYYNRSGGSMAVDGYSPVSEVTQAEQIEETGIMGQQSLDVIAGSIKGGSNGWAAPVVVTEPSHLEGEQSRCKTCLEHSVEDANQKELAHSDGRYFECYKRRKILSIGA